jgi:hypothetical protein
VLIGLACLAAVARAAPPATQPAPPERAPFTPRHVLWQPLPDDVYGIHVAPDDRVWYVYSSNDLPRDSADLRKRVEREFHKPSPQLAGASPLLFEPGGRVWFIGWGVLRQTFFGYDGKTWVEHALRTGHFPEGEGRFAAGMAFFADNLGIECFDGKVWTYQPLKTHAPDQQENPRLEVEPDGKGVVAVVAGTEPQMWRWRDGRWGRAADPVGLRFVTGLAPTPTGVWTLHHTSGLRFHPYDPKDPATVPNLIGQLSADDAGARDRATAALSGMGDDLIPALERALADERQPARIVRLQTVLANLQGGEAPGPSAFGECRVKGVRGIAYLRDRTICLAATAITDPDGKAVGPGMILQPAGGGAARVFPGERLAGAFGYGDIYPPLFVGDGSRVWLPRAYKPDKPMALVDLKTGRTVARVNDPRFRFFRAARADGTLFVTSGDRGGPQAIFTPGAPDDRPPPETPAKPALGVPKH